MTVVAKLWLQLTEESRDDHIRFCHLANAPKKVSLLNRVRSQSEGTRVCRGRLLQTAESSKQVCARRMKKVVLFQLSGCSCFFDQGQAFLDFLAHSDRCRMIQGNNWRSIDSHQLFVERHNLGPISFAGRFCFGMNGRDSRLQLVNADAMQSQRLIN